MSTAAIAIQTSERMASVPPFRLGGVTFHCWAIDEDHYEWRSEDGRLVVGRNVGSATCWARVNGIERGREYVSLRRAMVAAVGADS